MPFLNEPRVNGVVVVLAAGDREWGSLSVPETDKLFVTTEGGSERGQSVLNGLRALAGHAAREDWVLVHDAARPCLAAEDLDCLLGRLWDDETGGLLALPVRDTLKREAPGTGKVSETVARDGLWLALTPQMFRYGVLERALVDAIRSGEPVTDEAAAVERAGYAPRLIEGRPQNLKLTYPGDFDMAECLMRRETETCE